MDAMTKLFIYLINKQVAEVIKISGRRTDRKATNLHCLRKKPDSIAKALALHQPCYILANNIKLKVYNRPLAHLLQIGMGKSIGDNSHGKAIGF